MDLILGIALVIVSFAGGWYCKGKFGATAATDLTKAETVVADVKKL